MVYLVMLVGRYVDNFDMVMLLGKRVFIIGMIFRNWSDDYKVDLICDFIIVCLFVFENKEFRVNIDIYYSIEDIGEFYVCLENNDM